MLYSPRILPRMRLSLLADMTAAKYYGLSPPIRECPQPSENFSRKSFHAGTYIRDLARVMACYDGDERT